MENLFVESEEIVYKVIVGDPIFDVYGDDDWIQDKYVDQSDVCVVMVKNDFVVGFTPNENFQVNHTERVGFTNLEEPTCVSGKKEGASSYSDMVTLGVNKSYFCNENMKIGFHEGVYYFIQLGKYYQWKSRKKIRFHVKISSFESFEVEDHG
ncbi:hypothetical protein Bca101_042578 [Brassica carinata]